MGICLWAALPQLAAAQTEAEIRAEVEAYMPPPEGWPWLLGDVTGKLGGRKIAWQTYDFSIGALDASVWAGNPWGPVEFYLRGLTPGDPESDRMVLRVKAGFGGQLHPGKAEGPVSVMITLGADDDGPRLSSEGQKASLTITSLVASTEDQNYGHVTGTLSARLCPILWDNKACQDFTAAFDTDMQFDNEFPIAFSAE